MSKVIIFGMRDNAALAHYYLTHDSKDEVVAFTVDKEFLKEDTFLGLPVKDFSRIEDFFPPDEYKMFIPMSPARLNSLRAKKYLEAKEKGYRFISYISSKATYYGSEIGENCFIFENNVIQPFSQIGSDVIIWSGNHIGHHSRIEDHCFITSHAVVSGHVEIGAYSFLGVNCTIRNGIKIAKGNVIGAGALITADTKEYEVYPGYGSKASRVPSTKLKDL